MCRALGKSRAREDQNHNFFFTSPKSMFLLEWAIILSILMDKMKLVVSEEAGAAYIRNTKGSNSAQIL